MPAYPDAVVLQRQLRPSHERAPDSDVLERILAAPPERPRRPRGPRRLALAGVALTVLVVSLTPVLRGSPDRRPRVGRGLGHEDLARVQR